MTGWFTMSASGRAANAYCAAARSAAEAAARPANWSPERAGLAQASRLRKSENTWRVPARVCEKDVCEKDRAGRSVADMAIDGTGLLLVHRLNPRSLSERGRFRVAMSYGGWASHAPRSLGIFRPPAGCRKDQGYGEENRRL